jgi:hypothetical protein
VQLKCSGPSRLFALSCYSRWQEFGVCLDGLTQFVFQLRDDDREASLDDLKAIEIACVQLTSAGDGPALNEFTV